MPARTTRRYRTLAEVIEAVTADDSSDSNGETIDVCIGAQSEMEDISDDLLATEEPGDVPGELEVFSQSGSDESHHDSTGAEVAASPSKRTATKKQTQPSKRRKREHLRMTEKVLTHSPNGRNRTRF